MAAPRKKKKSPPFDVTGIDFSVITTALQTGGKMIEQIMNGIQYGSPEVRLMMLEECDFILECRVCRALFRALPNFIAHKRVYCCQAFSDHSHDTHFQAATSTVPPQEEIVVVEPMAPEDAPLKNLRHQRQAKDKVKEVKKVKSGVDSASGKRVHKPDANGSTGNKPAQDKSSSKTRSQALDKNGDKPPSALAQTLHRIEEGQLGKSQEFALYSAAAEKMEREKVNAEQREAIHFTPIAATPYAVFVNRGSEPSGQIIAQSLPSQPTTDVEDRQLTKNSPKEGATAVLHHQAISNKASTSTDASGTRTSNADTSTTRTSNADTSAIRKPSVARATIRSVTKVVKELRQKKEQSVMKQPENALKQGKSILMPVLSEAKLPSPASTKTVSKSTKEGTPTSSSSSEHVEQKDENLRAVVKRCLTGRPGSLRVSPFKAGDWTPDNVSEAGSHSDWGESPSSSLRPDSVGDHSIMDEENMCCKICNKSFAGKKTLMYHCQSRHSGQRTIFPCPYCPCVFYYFWGLTRHLNTNHKKTRSDIDRMRKGLHRKAYKQDISEEHMTRAQRAEQRNTTEGQPKVRPSVHAKKMVAVSKSISPSSGEKSPPTTLYMPRRRRQVEVITKSKKSGNLYKKVYASKRGETVSHGGVNPLSPPQRTRKLLAKALRTTRSKRVYNRTGMESPSQHKDKRSGVKSAKSQPVKTESDSEGSSSSECDEKEQRSEKPDTSKPSAVVLKDFKNDPKVTSELIESKRNVRLSQASDVKTDKSRLNESAEMDSKSQSQTQTKNLGMTEVSVIKDGSPANSKASKVQLNVLSTDPSSSDSKPQTQVRTRTTASVLSVPSPKLESSTKDKLQPPTQTVDVKSQVRTRTSSDASQVFVIKTVSLDSKEKSQQGALVVKGSHDSKSPLVSRARASSVSEMPFLKPSSVDLTVMKDPLKTTESLAQVKSPPQTRTRTSLVASVVSKTISPERNVFNVVPKTVKPVMARVISPQERSVTRSAASDSPPYSGLLHICPHCHRAFGRKISIGSHTKICIKNPANKPSTHTGTPGVQMKSLVDKGDVLTQGVSRAARTVTRTVRENTDTKAEASTDKNIKPSQNSKSNSIETVSAPTAVLVRTATRTPREIKTETGTPRESAGTKTETTTERTIKPSPQISKPSNDKVSGEPSLVVEKRNTRTVQRTKHDNSNSTSRESSTDRQRDEKIIKAEDRPSRSTKRTDSKSCSSRDSSVDSVRTRRSDERSSLQSVRRNSPSMRRESTSSRDSSTDTKASNSHNFPEQNLLMISRQRLSEQLLAASSNKTSAVVRPSRNQSPRESTSGAQPQKILPQKKECSGSGQSPEKPASQRNVTTSVLRKTMKAKRPQSPKNILPEPERKTLKGQQSDSPNTVQPETDRKALKGKQSESPNTIQTEPLAERKTLKGKSSESSNTIQLEPQTEKKTLKGKSSESNAQPETHIEKKSKGKLPDVSKNSQPDPQPEQITRSSTLSKQASTDSKPDDVKISNCISDTEQQTKLQKIDTSNEDQATISKSQTTKDDVRAKDTTSKSQTTKDDVRAKETTSKSQTTKDDVRAKETTSKSQISKDDVHAKERTSKAQTAKDNVRTQDSASSQPSRQAVEEGGALPELNPSEVNQRPRRKRRTPARVMDSDAILPKSTSRRKKARMDPIHHPTDMEPEEAQETTTHTATEKRSGRATERGGRSRTYVVEPSRAGRLTCQDTRRVEQIVDETGLTCLHCDQHFTSVSNLRRHAIRHLGWKRFKCRLCRFCSYDRSECNTHIMRTHFERVRLGSGGARSDSFITDLNRQAASVRSLKKRQTITSRRKEEEEEGGKTFVSLRSTRRTVKAEELMEEENVAENPWTKDSNSATRRTTSRGKTAATTSSDNLSKPKPPAITPTASSTTAFNISTRNSPREFDTRPYPRQDKPSPCNTFQSAQSKRNLSFAPNVTETDTGFGKKSVEKANVSGEKTIPGEKVGEKLIVTSEKLNVNTKKLIHSDKLTNEKSNTVGKKSSITIEKLNITCEKLNVSNDKSNVTNDGIMTRTKTTSKEESVGVSSTETRQNQTSGSASQMTNNTVSSNTLDTEATRDQEMDVSSIDVKNSDGSNSRTTSDKSGEEHGSEFVTRSHSSTDWLNMEELKTLPEQFMSDDDLDE